MSGREFLARPTIGGAVVPTMEDIALKHYVIKPHQYVARASAGMANGESTYRNAYGAGGVAWTAGTANGYMEYDVPPLAVGTWVVLVLRSKAPSYGIMRGYLDGVSLGVDDDQYAAAENLVPGVAGWSVVIATIKPHVLRLENPGTKNGASSGYVINHRGLHLRRTGP